jgi:hypothetical protein
VSGPDRILVYGVTGSGKSTAATRIAAATGLPLTLVDELTWLPGWVPVDGVEQRRVIGEIVRGERWVLDSAYGAWLDLVLPRVELVVGLDYPRWLSLARLVRRTLSSAITKAPHCNGNVESGAASSTVTRSCAGTSGPSPASAAGCGPGRTTRRCPGSCWCATRASSRRCSPPWPHPDEWCDPRTL